MNTPISIPRHSESTSPSGFGYDSSGARTKAFHFWPEESFGPLLDQFLSGERMPAFLGLSAHTSFSNSGRFSALLEWLGPRVSSCAILEGTYLTRWNLRALQGLSQGEAERTARSRSLPIERRLKRIIEEEGLQHRVFYLSWERLVSLPLIRNKIELLRRSFERRGSFNKQVQCLVSSFLERKGCSEGSVELLAEYVLEEVAVLLHMCESGRSLEIYPGKDLRIMRMVSAGRFPDLPLMCSQRTHVALHFESGQV